MATMREVAARAGVSAKTVSRVFNGDPHVLPETRAHVQRVMQELNYVPNVLATTFRSGRSSIVGVAVPDIIDPFFAAITRAVDEVARREGLSTMVTSLGEDPALEREILESLLSRKLSGLVVAPIGTDHAWLGRWREHTPIVSVDRAPIGLPVDTFTEDDEAGAQLATRHLIDHGHRRIAYLGDMIHLSTEQHRLLGYRQALTGARIELDDALVAVHASTREETASALERFWSLEDPPTAVFSANARNSMHLAQILGPRKHEVAVVGFGDFPLADVLDPPLTVIDQNPRQLGLQAAERIFERLAEPTRRLSRVNVMEVELIERESCAVGRPTAPAG